MKKKLDESAAYYADGGIVWKGSKKGGQKIKIQKDAEIEKKLTSLTEMGFDYFDSLECCLENKGSEPKVFFFWNFFFAYFRVLRKQS